MAEDATCLFGRWLKDKQRRAAKLHKYQMTKQLAPDGVPRPTYLELESSHQRKLELDTKIARHRNS